MQGRRDFIKRGATVLSTLALPVTLSAFTKFHNMANNKNFDVIIIGGSYAGLSAAMALGRALRNVLMIDSGLPCNRQTPHSHNFITQDGAKPSDIAEKAKAQVLKYNTVKIHYDLAVIGQKTKGGFNIITQNGWDFTARKLIFASGVKDIMQHQRFCSMLGNFCNSLSVLSWLRSKG